MHLILIKYTLWYTSMNLVILLKIQLHISIHVDKFVQKV